MQSQKNSVKKVFYTVGHSNTSMEYFLKLVSTVKIKVLVDVRSLPYSKYVPEFNKQPLKTRIKNAGIEYIFLGDKIGGKPDDAQYNDGGEVCYEKIGSSFEFSEGISNLIELSDQGIIIMCSEENPYQCHRHLLIAQNLIKQKNSVFHLRADKTLEKAKLEDTQLKLI